MVFLDPLHWQDCPLRLAMMANDTATDWETNRTFSSDYRPSYIEHPGCVIDYENHFLVPLYFLFFMVGFIGNALVVWVIITVGIRLKTMTDVGLLNLALADLLLVWSLPLRLYNMFYSWIFGKAICTLVHGMYFLGFFGGIFFIVLMSIDRYLAVVHGVFALRVRTKARRTVASLVIWILAVAASFPELLYVKTERMENENHEFCTIDTEQSLVSVSIFKMNIVGLLVPLIIVGFCYSMILWRLHRSHSPKKHSIRLIILVRVVFFCCWVPYNIALFLGCLQVMNIIASDCKSTNRLLMTLEITGMMAFSTSYLNPFIYAFVRGKFRRHFVRLIRERRLVCCS